MSVLHAKLTLVLPALRWDLQLRRLKSGFLTFASGTMIAARIGDLRCLKRLPRMSRRRNRHDSDEEAVWLWGHDGTS